jgi:hypothetical protein
VRVSIDGEPAREATLISGDRLSWQGSTFEIVADNAGGVLVELDGVPQPPLGESGRQATIRLPRPPSQ